jgi:hypothetical protein
MAKKKTLDVPPFPPLRWDEYSWVGKVKLPSWAGFQARGGAYGSRSSKKRSDGTVRLDVAVEDDEAQTPPNAAQIAAMRHLLDNEKAVASAVLEAIFEMYPEAKAEYEAGYGEEEDETLPTISDPKELRALMGLSTVHILDVKKGAAAYIGFEFGCAWEEEHGAGVMTHRGRVVEVGQADTAFLEWIAERDAKRRKKK